MFDLLHLLPSVLDHLLNLRVHLLPSGSDALGHFPGKRVLAELRPGGEERVAFGAAGGGAAIPAGCDAAVAEAVTAGNGHSWSKSPRFFCTRMQNWGLNTYLYGPKDDLKHRLLWREVYSPEEEGNDLLSTRDEPAVRLRPLPREHLRFDNVSDLGCQAFAILFDDIDHSLCQADSEAFSSFAHAQVTVTNEMYRFLGEPPVFLFCPTEYCGSLCSPSVQKSPYLQTVGEDLLPDITVIWTGNKVISRKLSVDRLAEVESVLQRPPLIWDNLHANDYDSRRLFLGPFKGREPWLRGHLRGLLLNPNCEFEANYIPLHTLASWYRAGSQERKGDIARIQGKNRTSCRIYFPNASEGQFYEETDYCPDRALSAALHDWMEELNQPLQAGEYSTGKGESEVREGEKRQPGQVPASRPAVPAGGGRGRKAQGRGLSGGKGLLSEAQVQLLVGLHYLPHEHGPSAQKLIQDLTWLKSNCHLVSANSKKSSPHKFGHPRSRVDEWRDRASGFLSLCEDIAQLHCSVVGGANRAVLYDLYPYVWDLRNMALVAKAFVCWLGEERTTTGTELLGEESEPWALKGGVSGEVQMLLPIGGSGELFTHPPPLFPTSRLYNIRPYRNKDKCGQDSGASHPDVVGDRCLGPCLALCPEYSFILEDELGVCGCILGILDVRSFAKRCQASWLPAMRDKYLPKGDLIKLMEEDQGEYPDSLLYHFPSQLRLDTLPELVDVSVSRTLLVTLLVALKANGSQGVFCEVQPTDRQRLEFLTKLGFLEILRGEARSREGVVMARLL
uniref:Si:dkey-183c6.8 n=1 Tax=Hippocampus comes TaxID=109280 RepID=A0A3Q2XBH4_HIPCM